MTNTIVVFGGDSYGDGYSGDRRKSFRSENGRRGNQVVVRSVANQMELETGVMPTLIRRLPSWAVGPTKARF
jgi:hypothetical protein